MMSSCVRCLSRLILVSLLLAPAAHILAARTLDGDWQLNTEKSKFSPGPPLQSQSRTYRTDGDMQSLTIRSVDAKGESTTSRGSYRLDGKDYPLEGAPEIDSIAMTKVNDTSARGTAKRDGKVVFTIEREVSPDGNTLTIIQKGRAPDGRPMHNVLVFDRE